MIETSTFGSASLVRVTAEQIDLANVDRFLAVISSSAMSVQRGSKFILDLQAVELLATQGINVLVAVHKQLLHAGGELRLRGVREDVYAKLRMLNLTSLLTFEDVAGRTRSDVGHNESRESMRQSRHGDLREVGASH